MHARIAGSLQFWMQNSIQPALEQPRRHEGALVGFAPPNKALSPQIEKWNTINKWSFG